MELFKSANVYIGHSVTIGKHEGLIPHILLYSLDTSSCHGIESGINYGHLPGLIHIVMNFHTVIAEIKGNIRVVQEVIRKKLFYDILLIARQYDEIIVAVA